MADSEGLCPEVQKQATQQVDTISLRERFLEAVLESATDYAIIALDPRGLVTTWNEGARRILGWTETEMLGQPAATFFTEQDRLDRVPRREMDAALALGRGLDERWHLRKDGSRFWANGEMMPLLDPAGGHLGYLKILRDRTEQRLAAERQREDAEFLRGVLASSGDCIKVLDLEGGIVFMTDTGRRLMEISDFNTVRDCSWSDFWEGEAGAAARGAVATARAGGAGQFRAPAPTLAGNPRWWDVVVTPILGADGQPERLLAVSRDITAVVAAERRLAAAEERQRMAAEAANFGTWDMEIESRTLRCDSRCRALFGIFDDRPLGFEDFTGHIHPDDRAEAEAAIARALDPAGTGHYALEHRVLGVQDGTERWVAATGQVRFEGGQAVRFVGAISDITPRKMAEAHARLLGEELQHRIKNTLAMVQAIVRQTLRGQPTIPQAQEAIDQRLAAMGRAHGMLTAGGWTSSDLRAVIDAALDLHDDRSGRFRIQGPEVVLPAQAAMSLALLLHELSTNAAKYGALSTAEGRVEISWTLQAAPGRDDGARALSLVWREQGGPPVTEPAQRGFGSRLIERSLGSALNGSAAIEFLNQGVVCTVKGCIEPSPE